MILKQKRRETWIWLSLKMSFSGYYFASFTYGLLLIVV